jgi:hypothetical protein
MSLLLQEVKKTPLKPHLKECWCIPPEQKAEYVSRMGEVREVYKRPSYNEVYHVVCMDEKPLQVLADQRTPQPMTQAHNLPEDREYGRCGTCSIFMFNEPVGR